MSTRGAEPGATGAVYLPRGDGRFLPTELSRGPWDPGAQHGGAPSALLVRAFERLAPDERLLLARVTYEFVRPVPLAELEVRAEVIRPGRRVQLLEGSVLTTDGQEVVRARALRVVRTDVEAGPDADRAPEPDVFAQARASDYPRAELAMFATDAMDIRFVQGTFNEPGPATAWFRLRVPLVDGEQTTSLQRLAAAGDFGNGISAAVSWDHHLFINPDLTLYLERSPVGELICLKSRTRIATGGIGIAESVLYDERGRVGRAVQALVVAKR